MGKSSLLVQTRKLLEELGYLCTTIDLTQIGSENITPVQWYKGMMTELRQGFFNLVGCAVKIGGKKLKRCLCPKN